VLGLPLFFVRVFVLVSARHSTLLDEHNAVVQTPYRSSTIMVDGWQEIRSGGILIRT
jgi:hypothetical protein